MRGGSIYALAAMSLVALLASLGVAVDVGRVVVAAQRAQDVADSAARAAMLQSPSADYGLANRRIGDIVAANNVNSPVPITWDTSDVTYYSPGDYLPGWGSLGTDAEATRVYTHINLSFFFAPAVGISGTTVTRYAIAASLPAAGAPIIPIWITETTPYQYGQEQNLLMADGPHYPGIPGNFGWLTPPSGSNDFLELLQGYNVAPDLLAANSVTTGQTVWGLTGMKTGQWTAALGASGYGRLARASWPQWAGDTFADYQKDNPRLMIIPICQYVEGSGSGSNAQFTIVKFGVWWLESLGSNNKTITGRFIKYVLPGATSNPGATFTGLWTDRLVR